MKIKSLGLFCCLLGYWMSSSNASAAFITDLQGQSKGDTNWVNVNLQGWKEMDYIPIRVSMSGGPISNRVVSVDFDHSKNLIPGIQNLTAFSASTNVIIKSGPTLSGTSGTEVWSYQFTVDVTDGNPAEVKFLGRLSAGAHLFVGSSLALSSPTLQIHKPAPAPGNPDLLIQKSGPTHAAIGETITYTIFYTNLASPFNTDATGVQITDILPDCVTYIAGSATGGGSLAANVLTWDLGPLALGSSGTLTYQVIVATNAPTGQNFMNWARIFSAEDDADFSNNESRVTTAVDAPANSAPIAFNDTYDTEEDATLNVVAAGVLTNDIDADGDILSSIMVTPPSHGLLTLNAAGSFLYSPATNYNGTDAFTYRASDGKTNSPPATVSIIVHPVNDAPIAVDDSYSTGEDVALNVTASGVLANDTDVDGGGLTAILATLPAHGTLVLNTNGAFVYTPATNYNGADSFTYRANDGLTNSAVATVHLSIQAVNDRPVAVDDNYNTAEDTVLNVTAAGVLGNDTDPDGDGLSAILVTLPTHGTLTLNTNGAFVYSPAPNYNGTDSFTYRANDRLTNSAVATVTIAVSPINDVPVAIDDNSVTDEDVSLSVVVPGVLGNDSDIDGDVLKAILVSPPGHGTLTLNTNGSFLYKPATNYSGSDSFTYKASDGKTNSAAATVSLTIRSLNDPPVAANDSYTIDEDQTLNASAPGVLANDVDVDGNPLGALLVAAPGHGTVVLNTNGSFVYVPAANYNGNDSFTYYARDGATNSTTATVNIVVRPVNDAPSFSLLPLYAVNEDSGLQSVVNFAADISPGASNEINQQLSMVVTNSNPSLFLTQPALTLAGTLTFTPTPNAFGTSVVTAILSDNGGLLNGGKDTSLPKSFTLVVNPVNDPPVFTKGTNQFLNQNASGQNIVGWASNISPGPANESEQSVSFIVTNDNPVLFTESPQIDQNGTLTYTPSPGTFGVAHVVAVIKDNGGTDRGGVDESAAQEFLITINAPPVARIVSPTNGSVFIASVPITILCDAIDPDGTVTNLALFQEGQLCGNLKQPYLYTWNNAASGSHVLTATATDDAGLTSNADPVSITVIPEPPLTVIGAIHLNPQTGLFEEAVKITNPTAVAFNGVRILVRGLTNGATVHNAGGAVSGTQYVEYRYPIPAGQSGNLIIEYYVPSRVPPIPTLSAELINATPLINPSGTPMQIDRLKGLSDGSMLIEFMSVTNRVYYIQYSSDLQEWETAFPSVTGTGSRMQWIDNGPPKTDAWPSTRPFCVYRILQMP